MDKTAATLTKYSTKQTWASSLMIMYCKDRNPLSSILIEILEDKCKAFVEGFRRLILYLTNNDKTLHFSARCRARNQVFSWVGNMDVHIWQICWVYTAAILYLTEHTVCYLFMVLHTRRRIRLLILLGIASPIINSKHVMMG